MPVWPGGFEGPGIGTRALAMGGAFVGLADDWSAAYWNPAGLAQLRGTGVGGDLDWLSIRAHDGNSLANPLPPFQRSNIEQGDVFFQLGGEPSQFNVKDTQIRSILPSLVGHRTWSRWTLAMGIFAPLGYAFDVEDQTIPGFDVQFKNEGYIVMYDLSAAYQFSPRWSAGAGVNLVDARIKKSAEKDTSTYTYNATSDGRGQSVQGVIGLLGHLTPSLSLGAAYKTGSTVTLDGAATISDSRFPLSVPGFGTLANESSAQHIDLYNPATYSAGLAWRPLTALTLTADWEGTDWTPMRVKAHFNQQGVFLQDQDFEAGWRFTHRARVGGEYRHVLRARESWSVQWGYIWDPYAVPDSAVSMTNLVDVSRHFYSAGACWTHGAWTPQIAFSFATGHRNVGGVDYKQVSQLWAVSLQYRTGS